MGRGRRKAASVFNLQTMFLARAVIVLTGTFSESKEDFKKKITSHGGQVVNSLSKQVTHVVCGEGASKSTLQEAEELNIPIVTEQLICSTLKEGKILVPWFTSRSTKASTNHSISMLFNTQENDSCDNEETKEDEEVDEMRERFSKLSHKEVPMESTPETYSSKDEVSPTKEEPILSPLSRVVRAKELVVEARKLEMDGNLEESLVVYRKASEMVSYNRKLRKKVERLEELLKEQNELDPAVGQVVEEPEAQPISEQKEDDEPEKETTKELPKVEKPNKKQNKKRSSANRTPAKSLTVFDFTETPPSQKPAKKERKRSGSLSGTTFFIQGSFSLPRATIEALITMEGGAVSKTFSSQVTHFLFDGNIESSAFTKAKQMQVHIVDEYFLDLLNEEH